MTPAQYLAQLPPDRRNMLQAIRTILTARPALKEYVGGTARSPYIGYSVNGQYAYGLAGRKDGIRLYSMSLVAHPALKKKYGPTLGKFLVGKSCLRFRKMDEIDTALIRAYVRDVAKLQAVQI